MIRTNAAMAASASSSQQRRIRGAHGEAGPAIGTSRETVEIITNGQYARDAGSYQRPMDRLGNQARDRLARYGQIPPPANERPTPYLGVQNEGRHLYAPYDPRSSS